MKTRRMRKAGRRTYESIEALEDRTLLAADFRLIDGTGNNLLHPDWGSAGTQLLRNTTVEYGDGISSPAGTGRPSPREVSNNVVAQSGSILNEGGLSDFVWQWGQFLDHDLDLTTEADPHEAFPIPVPTGDPFFDPNSTGTATIGLSRSVYDTATGLSTANPRQQINQITAFIDASNVYGSDPTRADALRTFIGGKLKMSDDELLPFNVDGLPNGGGTGDTLFVAGDVRANEQVGLTALHTLFVREHNRLADIIAAQDPSLSDEEIYQRARQIVGAEMQVITYNEFLPALLGEGFLPTYTGYDATVNPEIANVFSTAAYRLGHTLLSPNLLRVNNDGIVIAEGNLALRDAFFAPQEIIATGIEPLLMGLALQPAQELDAYIVDDVRNFLFGLPGAGGFDLASLNIQRGRDHGLADYNQTRVDLGLAPVSSFAEITSDPALRAKLEATYASVNEIDVWVGGLAEDHLSGSSLGELFSTILADQFSRLRDGDRYWYQEIFSGSFLEELETTTLADIIRWNTDLSNIPADVFHVRPAETGYVATGGPLQTINLDGNGNIQVVLYSTNSFDATSVKLGSIKLAGASPFKFKIVDVDHDGDRDLVLSFKARQTRLAEVYRDYVAQDLKDGNLDSLRHSMKAGLTGETYNGERFASFATLDSVFSGKELLLLLWHTNRGG